MKNFKDYLVESERTYNYRIKIVGDVTADWLKQLQDKCQQFDIVKFGSPKRTPVQLKPADFPKHSNDSVTSIDVEFRYPAIEPQIKQLAQLLFMDPNRVIMLTAEQKALSNDYSAPYNQHAVLKNAYKSDFTVAGGKTPPAVTTNDSPMGTTSPMTKIKRPQRPATGAQPRG